MPKRSKLVLMMIHLLMATFVMTGCSKSTGPISGLMQNTASQSAAIKGESPGFVFVDGDVSRPGIYAIPAHGTLTLPTLMIAAGLDELPVTAKIVRVVDGKDKKVYEGTFASLTDLRRGIRLSPDDRVVVSAGKEM